jgi:hypothetical protein
MSTTMMLSTVGLSAAVVRQMTRLPSPLPMIALPKPCKPRIETAPRKPCCWHPPKGVGVNLDKINAWLATAAPGDECDRNSLGLGNGGQAALTHFVRQGKLTVVRAARYGSDGHPIIYAKL